MLAVVGDLIEDVVVWLRAPVSTGTDNPARVYRGRGGSAANVAAFATTGARTRFIGRVGVDRLGDALVDELAESGVDVRVQRAGRTGSLVLLVDTHGERTMFGDRGAAAELDAVPGSWLDDVRLLHVPAYAFATEPSATAVLEMAGVVTERGGTVTMDASSTAMLADYGPRSYLDLVDKVGPSVLFANAAEARLLELTHRIPPPGRVFVVKDGGRPTTILGASGRRSIPVSRVATPRDTTGAGDAFAAGYLCAMLRGAQPEMAVVAGHQLAVEVLDSPGARLSTREVP